MTPFPFCTVAAVRPALLTLVSPISVATIADAMRSMDVLALYVFVSRDLGHFRVTCHRLAYSYVSIPVSRDSYCTCMCHGSPPRLFFVMLTFSRLCLLLIFGCDNSSFPVLLTPICSPDDSSLTHSRFFLRPVLYPTFHLLLTYLTGRYSCLVLLWLYASLYLYFP